MLTDTASVATIITAIFVIISVWCVWRQLRENSGLARAANAQSLVAISSPFTMGLIQDRNMAELWVRGAHDFESMDVVDQARYRSMLTWWLILQENIFYQHEKRLLDADIYEAWNADLVTFVKEQNLGLHWKEMSGGFESKFALYVQSLIDQYTPKESFSTEPSILLPRQPQPIHQ